MSLLIHTHMLNGWEGTRLHCAQASPERLFQKGNLCLIWMTNAILNALLQSYPLVDYHTNLKAEIFFLYWGGWQGSLFYTFSDPSLCLLPVHFTLRPDKSNTPLLQSATRILLASGREGFEANKTIYAIQETERVRAINPGIRNEWKR